MRDYAEAALAQGLEEIGFSDHAPLPRGLGSKVRMREEELEGYVEEVLALRKEYEGRLRILLGIECDHVEGLEEYNRGLLESYPFDYALGSVHYLDSECRESAMPKDFEGSVEDHYSRYFALVERMAASGLFDVAGHFDFARRIHRPLPAEGREGRDRALFAVAKAGMALEVNTSGYRHATFGLVEPFPSLEALARAKEWEIPICVNSDAHDPIQVGYGFAECRESLLKLGFTGTVRFENRRRRTVPL